MSTNLLIIYLPLAVVLGLLPVGAILLGVTVLGLVLLVLTVLQIPGPVVLPLQYCRPSRYSTGYSTVSTDINIKINSTDSTISTDISINCTDNH